MKWRTRQTCVLLPVFIAALLIAGMLVFTADSRVIALGAGFENATGISIGEIRNWLQRILEALNWMIELVRSLILGRE